MRVELNIENRLKMLSSMRNDTIFQVLEYDTLEGAKTIKSAMALQYINQANMKLRQARVILDDSSIIIKPGVLSYMKGNVRVAINNSKSFSIGKKFLGGNKVSSNSSEYPCLEGKGEIYLEPSFGYFSLLELEDEEIMVNYDIFYACESNITVSSKTDKDVDAVVYGDNGVKQIKLSGSGIVLLELPVPESEVFRCKMYEDVLKIDGKFAILRSNKVEFSVEKSGSDKIGEEIDGQGYLNVYRGTGEVWLVPTKVIYDEFEDIEIDKNKI